MGGAGISRRCGPAPEPPSLRKQSSGRMSLGWTPVLAALAVIVLNEWERSNAGSHALVSHAAALLAPWTCCLSGGGDSESGRCARRGTWGHTCAGRLAPCRLRPVATGGTILAPPASAWRVGTRTERLQEGGGWGGRSAEAGGNRSDNYPLKITRETGPDREELTSVPHRQAARKPAQIQAPPNG